jgi:hypothetical protein
VKCSATTRLSSRVSDRPSKLSQILEMGEHRQKLAVLATEDDVGTAGHLAIERTAWANHRLRPVS